MAQQQQQQQPSLAGGIYQQLNPSMYHHRQASSSSHASSTGVTAATIDNANTAAFGSHPPLRTLASANSPATIFAGGDRDRDRDQDQEGANGARQRGPIGRPPLPDSTETSSSSAAASPSSSLNSANIVDLRKEQNRVAQRAFRDRKERYLQQLENMIKELQEQHVLVTTQFQKKVQDITEKNEILLNENHYLRQVVFAFEVALSKGAAAASSPSTSSPSSSSSMSSSSSSTPGTDVAVGASEVVNIYAAILKSVKDELFRRHHANTAAASETVPFSSTLFSSSPVPGITITAAEKSPKTKLSMLVAEQSSPPADTSSLPIQDAAEEDTAMDTDATTIIETATSTSPDRRSPSGINMTRFTLKRGNGEDSHSQPSVKVRRSSSASPDDTAEQILLPPPSEFSSSALPSSLPPISASREILYKAPPLFIAPSPDEGGKLSVISSPLDALAIPRPSYLEPGTILPKVTEYPKHLTVFDELQSSLFPPGTLQSLVLCNMATPQEVIEDKSLFDPHQSSHASSSQQELSDMDRNKVSSANRKSANGGHNKNTNDRQNQGPRLDRSQFLPGDHRLIQEFEAIQAAPPATDPRVDPMIYTIPHDPRIDIVPCPQLRAQMILHQDKYDVEEIFQIILDGAICHGPPLSVHSWQLPQEVYTKYPFLWGPDGERHLRKVWPRKNV
ncbi:hypothetical protein BGZ83_011652 [Gryganskiella cystojenkinii]|nr:hypothetical protein BGZ83_011652 [Gryganskiella cystojenkinii]